MNVAAGNASPGVGRSRFQGHGGPSPLAVAGSVLLHAGLVGAIMLGGDLSERRDKAQPQFTAYRVNLYSPPPQVEGEPAEIVPKPAIVKTAPPAAPEVKAPAKQPAAKTATTAAPEKPKAAPVAGRNPKPGPVGGEGLNVVQDGAEFPYPEYLENIIRQLSRYFRWNGAGNLEAEIGFYIRKDGSASRIRLLKRSGNRQFDIAVVEATEQAGKRKAFGVLPPGFQGDSLGVSFGFVPPK